QDVTVIGITGTKGKTTTTYMIKEILTAAGRKVGLIGTIEAIIGNEHIPSKNTTPESYEVQEYLSRMRQIGIDTCVMEVSSQGLMMHRVDGIKFEIGIFTNIEPDHIGPGEHEDFDDYLSCKAKLFRKCKKGIFNADDEHLPAILATDKCEEVFFGFKDDADYRACDVELYKEGGMLGVKYRVEGLLNFDVRVNVPGRFSVYNSLTAIAVCHHFGVEEEVMKRALLSARVKGRIELYPVSDKYSVMIDYAHNAMSLRSLLTTLREYQPKRIVTLFGCGGNRSKDRRYEMGEVSGDLSDLTIITSDNPRFEEPQDIINDIKFGINKTSGEYVEIIDRKEAIRYAIENAKEGDVIVLAGKGHEDYQEIRGKKYPMDERVLLKEVMEELGMRSPAEA
nr:UDP-N-acetylmuramoyl-L-alanyl-D-glutamate--2,6-diaminopimelate ligase [Lachnospiraceae bacterium]